MNGPSDKPIYTQATFIPSTFPRFSGEVPITRSAVLVLNIMALPSPWIARDIISIVMLPEIAAIIAERIYTASPDSIIFFIP